VSKADGLPVVIVRGLAHDRREGTARELVMPPERDLFR
jgi:F420-0:gamma-glutamyl ligase